MTESNDWLDLQTQEQLAACPPEKLAPPTVAGYSLVLLERGYDRARIDRTLQSLVNDTEYKPPPCPFVLLKELSLADAMQGQFELICADSISVFIDSEVLLNAKKLYLNNLFNSLRKSREFQPVKIRVQSIPDGGRGEAFLQQFFGKVLKLPITQVVARKKARIMRHWATKLGAIVECNELNY